MIVAELENADLPSLPGGVPVACSKDNIITPREADGQCEPLLLPRDRVRASALIREHVVLKPVHQAAVDAFVEAHFSAEVIGVHVRGPGKFDGGLPARQRHLALTHGAPLDLYFSITENALASRHGAHGPVVG